MRFTYNLLLYVTPVFHDFKKINKLQGVGFIISQLRAQSLTFMTTQKKKKVKLSEPHFLHLESGAD